MKKANLRVIEGDKEEAPIIARKANDGGFDGEGHNWLIELPINTTFLVESYGFWLIEYTVRGKLENAVLLRENIRKGGKDESSFNWVQSEIFSKKNKFRGILHEK